MHFSDKMKVGEWLHVTVEVQQVPNPECDLSPLRPPQSAG